MLNDQNTWVLDSPVKAEHVSMLLLVLHACSWTMDMKHCFVFSYLVVSLYQGP